jgi:hypothetical protein
MITVLTCANSFFQLKAKSREDTAFIIIHYYDISHISDAFMISSILKSLDLSFLLEES